MQMHRFAGPWKFVGPCKNLPPDEWSPPFEMGDDETVQEDSSKVVGDQQRGNGRWGGDAYRDSAQYHHGDTKACIIFNYNYHSTIPF